MLSPCVNFLNQVKLIDEADYGDFMRKANHYLNALKDSVRDPMVAACLDVMQEYIQFNPNWDIPSTLEHMQLDMESLIELGL